MISATRVSLFAFLLFSFPCYADQLEFEGVPTKLVYVEEAKTTVVTVSMKQSSEAAVRIIQTDSGYIWASRKNVPLEKSESGSYITYTARNGSGYIRVVNPALRSMIQALPPSEREKEFIYMEHLVNRLGSLTYFGK